MPDQDVTMRQLSRNPRPLGLRAVRNGGYAALATLFAGLIVALVALWPAAADRGLPLVAAPDVQFKLIDGRVVELAAQRGNVVMVDFWATSCAICIAEMPELQALDAEFAAQGLVSVAVAMPYDRPDHVLHFVKTRNVALDVALDIQGKLVASLGPVRGTPTRLIIDRNGLIVTRLEGAQRPGALRSAVLAALAR